MELFPFRQPSTARADDGDLAAIARQLDDVMAGTGRGDADSDDVDLRAYLLDPPPTEVEAARADRRRRMVRTGSLVATAILAMLLLAPWPSGDGVPDGTRAETAEPTFAGPAEATLPARVDVPAAGMEAPRIRAATRPARAGMSTPRRAAGRSTPVRQVTAHREPVTAARPTPARRATMPARDRSTAAAASPRPSTPPPPPAPIPAPATAPPTTGGELVPIL